MRQDRERPVFLDRSGRRRRLAVLLGVGLAAGLLASLGLLVAGLWGASPVSGPGFPEVEQPAGPAEARPSATTRPPVRPGDAVSTTPAATPAATPTATTAADRPGNRHTPSRRPSHPRPTKNK